MCRFIKRSDSVAIKYSLFRNNYKIPTFFMRMLRLSDAFLTNGDFLERVELSLSLRFICKDKKGKWNKSPQTLMVRYFACFVLLSFSHPADVLALGAGGERLGSDDGVPSQEWVLLVDVWPALFGSNHWAALAWQQAVHARLLVDLEKEKVAIKIFFLTSEWTMVLSSVEDWKENETCLWHRDHL